MALLIENKIKECDDGKRRERSLAKISHLVLHRISFAQDRIEPIPDLLLTGVDVARKFKETKEYRAGSYTGGELPYAFFVCYDGTIEQLLEVGDIGPAQKKWNVASIAVAVAGDFRSSVPTIAQWESLIDFCALWQSWMLKIAGHTDLPGASGDPSKECPGSMFDLIALQEDIDFNYYSRYTVEEAELLLTREGIVF